MRDTDVLIVGAGPTGLTLACVLAEHGVRFQIIEASPLPQGGSRGKGVQPRTLEVFDALGIVDRVIANGRFDIDTVQCDEMGVTMKAPSRFVPPRPDAPYLSTLLTPQWRIEEALREKLRELRVSVQFGIALTSYAHNDQGVTAQLASSLGEKTVRASWLVGCDGGKSLVRRQAGISFVGETHEAIRMMLGDVRLSGLDRDHWHIWRSAEGFLALCPLPSTDTFQLQAFIEQGQPDQPSRETFQQLITRRTGCGDIEVKDTVWESMWRANVRMVDRYRDGRVLLAGDAAHVHSPAGGQGMNTGIQDAFNLGWKLAAVLAGVDVNLIDSYGEERLPIASSVLGISNELMGKAVANRNLALQRDERTTQLGVNYRDASLSQDQRPAGEGLFAGDRAPDAPGLSVIEGSTRMFDLLRGPHITLLGFGARWRPLLDYCESIFGEQLHAHVIAAQQDPALSAIIDVEGHARAAYADDALFVIRPDNYVGFVTTCTDVTPLLDYLRRIALPCADEKTVICNG